MRLTLIGLMFCCISLVAGRMEIWQVNWAAAIVGFPLIIYGVARILTFDRE